MRSTLVFDHIELFLCLTSQQKNQEDFLFFKGLQECPLGVFEGKKKRGLQELNDYLCISFLPSIIDFYFQVGVAE